MKHYTALLTIVSAIAFCIPASADEGDEGRRRGPRGGQQSAKEGGKRGPSAGQRRGPGGGERNSQEMVARMLKQFDKDGDQKLDSTELAALLTSMRERRGGGPGAGQGSGPGSRGQAQRGRGGRGGPGEGQQGRGRRRGGDDAGPSGGQKPKRPSSDD